MASTSRVRALVRGIARDQLPSGLAPHVRWSRGRTTPVLDAVFGTTFVTHSLARSSGLLPPDERRLARQVVLRGVEALRRAPDDDGRVRFFGRESAIRPDVDDTACVWLTLSEHGAPCPETALDAIERAALGEGGGYANDFDASRPVAVELVSSIHALALLARNQRAAAGAGRYLTAEVERIERRDSPYGFFFPSRYFAAFCVVRAAVDFRCMVATAAAQRLAAWVARSIRPEAPLLERTWALWVLEASGRHPEVASRVRESCLADLDSSEDRAGAELDEPWFFGDPRAIEDRGVELISCPAARDAVLLDALLLPEQPERRLVVPSAVPTPEHAPHERHDVRVVSRGREGLRLEVSVAGVPVVVEVVRDRPELRAYKRASGWAFSYRGQDGSAGALAVDAALAWSRGAGARALDAPTGAGTRALGDDPERWAERVGSEDDARDAELVLPDAPVGAFVHNLREAQRVASARHLSLRGIPLCIGGPLRARSASTIDSLELPCAICLDAPRCDRPPRPWCAAHGSSNLRPRTSDEILVDVLRGLRAADLLTDSVLADVLDLRAAVEHPSESEVELSFKVRGDDLLEGPRLTWYQNRPDSSRTLAGFAALAGPRGEELAASLHDLCAGLPLHLGVVHGPSGRAAKLYVRTDVAPGDKHLEILRAAGDLRIESSGRRIHGIGIAIRDDAVRWRAYEIVPRESITADPRADSHLLLGWDLSPTGPPSLESRYLHYRTGHLTWADAAAIAGLGPALGARLGRALERAGRWYARFFGIPARGDARSLYVTLGPGVPRYDDDGP